MITAEDWDIPTLDLNFQATEIVPPVMKWGVAKRGAWAGTISFYADDVKFSRLWYDSSKLVDARPTVVVEPNFSTHPEMARAEVLYRTYKKRTLACEWQSQGIEIIVDLNVHMDFRDLMLLGVPKGWNAYATRKHRGVPLSGIEWDHALAVEHSGRPDPFFVVWGGGQKVQKFCKERKLIWIPEHRDVVAGRIAPYER